MATNINITTTNNNVTVTPDEKQVITSTTSQNIIVKDTETDIVTVATQGPQGPTGPQGPQGPAGDLPDTGSFATTGSNVFIGDQIISGSVTITGSLEVVGDITGTIESASYALSSSLAEEASNNFDTISYNNTTFGITAFRTNGGQQTTFITNVPSASYSDTASLADNATNADTATNANNVYVDAASTTTINVIPTYQADGGTDGYKSLQLSSNPLSYYYRTTNRQSGVSQQADELYIGGGTNTAGGIFLNSTVGIPSYVSADGPLHLFSQGYKVQISSSANDVEIIGNVTASANISASGNLFANVTDNSDTSYKTVVYDPITGQFFRTGSYGGGGGGSTPTLQEVMDEGSSTTTAITASIISASGDIVTNALTASGLNYPTVDGENGDVIQTDGAGNLSFGRTRIYAQVKNVSGAVLPKGIPVHVTSSVGNLDEVIAASASDASTMPATFVLAQQLNDDEEGLGILTGFINGVNTSGFNEGDVVYVAPNGGYTNQKPSGSNLIQNLGIVTKVAVNGSGFIYGSGRSNDVPNLLSGQIFFGSGSDQSHQIHISGALDQTIINNITASGNISASGNFIGNEITGSKLAITNGGSIPQPSGYSGLSTIINGGAFFNIVDETEKTFGIFSVPNGNDILRLDTDNLRFLIDPENDGFNFGIGTSTPPQKLTVQGNISASGEMVANSLRVENRASGVTADVIISGSTFDGDSRDAQIIYPSHGLHFNSDTSNNHVLALAGNSVGVRIQPDGNTALTVSGSINVIDGNITASAIGNQSGGTITVGGSTNFITIEDGGDQIIDFRGGETNFKYDTLFFKDAQDGATILLQGSNGADNVRMQFGDPEFESTGRQLDLDIDKASAYFNGLNITASNNISASGQIIGDVIDTSFENFLNFEAATSYTYIAPFPMTINFTGSSTSSMDVAGFVTASANSSSFSPQQGLPLTLNIFDKLKITPSSSGLFTFSGSRII